MPPFLANPLFSFPSCCGTLDVEADGAGRRQELRSCGEADLGHRPQTGRKTTAPQDGVAGRTMGAP